MKEHINTKNWPVVIVQMESDLSAESMQSFLDSWAGWLNKGEPFGLLFLFEGSENKHSGEIKKMRKNWLKKHRQQIDKTMAGVAMVIKSSTILNTMKPIANTVAKKMFGCSAKVFSWNEQDRASEWLLEQIHK